MTVEYAPHGLIGVLTPQANTTVEPEFDLLAARCGDDQCTPDERQGVDGGAAGRLFRSNDGPSSSSPMRRSARLRRDHRSVVSRGLPRERAVVGTLASARVPFVTAGLAVVGWRVKAGRIGIVSPYPEALTNASVRYWREHGFEVSEVRSSPVPTSFIRSTSWPAERAAGAALARGQAARRHRHARHRHADARADPASARMGRRAGHVLHALPGLGVDRRAGW